MLWLVAPTSPGSWLGPEHDRIAVLDPALVLSYTMNLAWSLGAAFARSVGKPWIEVGSLAVSLSRMSLSVSGVFPATEPSARSPFLRSRTAPDSSVRDQPRPAPHPVRSLDQGRAGPAVLLGSMTVALSAGLLAAGRSRPVAALVYPWRGRGSAVPDHVRPCSAAWDVTSRTAGMSAGDYQRGGSTGRTWSGTGRPATTPWIHPGGGNRPETRPAASSPALSATVMSQEGPAGPARP